MQLDKSSSSQNAKRLMPAAAVDLQLGELRARQFYDPALVPYDQMENVQGDHEGGGIQGSSANVGEKPPWASDMSLVASQFAPAFCRRDRLR